MNAENFVDFLKDYSKLYQLSYEELKSLVMQYPYCTNLHYLLLEKSQLDQHKELDQNTKTAAFYSQDRAALRSLIQRLKVTARQMESFELTEDYLELKDLSSINQEIEPLVSEDLLGLEQENTQNISNLFSFHPKPEPADLPEDDDGPYFTEEEGILDQPDHQEDQLEITEDTNSDLSNKQAGDGIEDLFNQLMSDAPFIEESINTTTEEEEEGEEEAVMESLNEDSPSPSQDPFSINEQDNSSANAHTDYEVEEDLSKSEDVMESTENLTIDQSNQPQPTPKSSFSSWVQQFQPAHIKTQLGDLMESKKREDAKQAGKKKKKKKKNKDKIVLFAEQSLKERKDLVSETLAKLLVSQEQYDKAIQMYERLMLKFPEKSGYFANKIKNIKNQ